MTDQEVKTQMARITRFREIENRIEEIWIAIKQIRGDESTSPFTGNYRESRQVSYVTIQFTPTRGGAEAVQHSISKLYIEAFDLGQFLIKYLESELGKLEEEKKAL